MESINTGESSLPASQQSNARARLLLFLLLYTAWSFAMLRYFPSLMSVLSYIQQAFPRQNPSSADFPIQISHHLYYLIVQIHFLKSPAA